MPIYNAFGLKLFSDLNFPELEEAPLDSSWDVEILRAKSPIGKVEGTSHEIRVTWLGTFLIENGKKITYECKEEADPSDIRLFILGSCLGCILQQRGYLVLHGNAVALDAASCKVIVGHQGTGKSTTAAWYFQQGRKILADDVCAISINEEGEGFVYPSYPQLKLWKASTELLGISTQGLRRIRSKDEKFGIPLGALFQNEPMRVSEISEIDPMILEDVPVNGAGKIKVLVEHSYRYGFLKKMNLDGQYFKKLVRLASQVKVSRGPRVNLAKVPTTV